MPPKKTISRRTTLACREHIASQAAASVSVLLLAITQSLVVSRNWRASPRLDVHHCKTRYWDLFSLSLSSSLALSFSLWCSGKIIHWNLLPRFIDWISLQGCMVTQRSSWLDQCPAAHCQLCLRGCCFHPRRIASGSDNQPHNCCKHHEEKQNSLQISEDSGDSWFCLCHLFW